MAAFIRNKLGFSDEISIILFAIKSNPLFLVYPRCFFAKLAKKASLPDKIAKV